MIGKWIVTGTLFVVCILAWSGAAWSSFHIQSDVAVHLEIKGYHGLTETSLFQGELATGVSQNVTTTYQGLALLVFAQGQSYPVILGKQSFTLHIHNPNALPSFTGSGENDYFYALLKGTEIGEAKCEFADLMIKAKQLLDSTGSIRSVDELQAMKEKIHVFVRTHYQDLHHSDMLRRLISQYFMMHEYVDYHVPDTPDTDIKERYQDAVMDGVLNWLSILNANIPQHEILNYCVSLYYNRSMVSLAHLIVENFKEAAYCPGDPVESVRLPGNLLLTNGKTETNLRDLQGQKLIAVVADDCPVSKVETVIKARRLAKQTDTTLIVIPLEPLSKNHLAMRRMVRGGNILFVDDEKWRKDNVPDMIKLPRFIQIEEKQLVKVGK